MSSRWTNSATVDFPAAGGPAMAIRRRSGAVPVFRNASTIARAVPCALASVTGPPERNSGAPSSRAPTVHFPHQSTWNPSRVSHQVYRCTGIRAMRGRVEQGLSPQIMRRRTIGRYAATLRSGASLALILGMISASIFAVWVALMLMSPRSRWLRSKPSNASSRSFR